MRKKKLKTYEVTLTQIYNGTVFVEASSEEEAMEIAEEMLENDEVSFQFGEATVDEAEEC